MVGMLGATAAMLQPRGTKHNNKKPHSQGSRVESKSLDVFDDKLKLLN